MQNGVGGYMSWPKKITISINILTNNIRSVDFFHRCVGCLQGKRCHRVAKFLRRRLLSACKVSTTILALKNVAPKSTNEIKDYSKRSDFCIFSSIYIFKYSFHLITKRQKSVNITQTYALCMDLNREHMFNSVFGMCWWPFIQNGVYCQM